MTIPEIIGLACIAAGMPFFLSGTIGMLRFPDIFTRLHALTKADNVGLGFLILGLCLQTDDWFIVIKLVLIWVLVLTASSTSCHLVARRALQKGIRPWIRQ
ncbi:MAG: monovalent cation/H(+) antiporter subunit G [Desulfobulbaceae bacterium]|nr:monovalent cation/H(+) antiporter subunit G [Desulfobulbaceae bacterium]MDY0351143.1 monovalent cation/H(+) antiporter subunit G [Desulfobulbaceae bacterium]